MGFSLNLLRMSLANFSFFWRIKIIAKKCFIQKLAQKKKP